VVAPPPPPPPPPEVVPDLAAMAADQARVEERVAADRAEQLARQTAALEAGTAGDYFFPEQTGWGATSIAPTAMNPEGYASHVVSVPWGQTSGPGDPAFQALLEAAAQKMVAGAIRRATS